MRRVGIDITRILACFMVVGIHTTPFYSDGIYIRSFVDDIFQSIYRVGLPLFFLISGFLLINPMIKTSKDWYINHLRKIMVPFIIVSFSYYVYFNGFGENFLRSYFTIITTTLTGASIHFWFVYVIIALYIALPVFNFVLNKINETSAIIIIILTLSAYSIITNASPFMEIFGVNIPRFSPGVMIWALYFAFGSLIGKIYHRVNYFAALLGIVIGFSLTLTMTEVKIRTSIDFRELDINASMLIYSSSILVVALQADSHLNKLGSGTKKLITYISNRTYSIYLIHLLVIAIIVNNLPSISSFLLVNNLFIVMTLACSIISFLVACVFDFSINKITNKVSKT